MEGMNRERKERRERNKDLRYRTIFSRFVVGHEYGGDWWAMYITNSMIYESVEKKDIPKPSCSRGWEFTTLSLLRQFAKIIILSDTVEFPPFFPLFSAASILGFSIPSPFLHFHMSPAGGRWWRLRGEG